MQLWHNEYGAFIRKAQMDFCRRLIVVPLTTFHRLAETIGDPRGELIFLFSTGRCGSTLFTKVKQKRRLQHISLGTVYFMACCVTTG